MTCVGCGFELSAGFAFCPQCGRPQAPVCAACGFSCQPGFAFCPRCGAALAAGTNGRAGGRRPAAPDGPEHEADRRLVTVLFADVSGFTTLAERLDPEEVRAFQGTLFETCARVITRYDGFIAKFLGDGVLALFGAPVAHEDDPERALSAALDLLADVAALGGPRVARLGQPLALHIAVHTGPVVAGSIRGDAGAGYDVSGDTVNTASRLLDAAAPGTILVSEATAALARHRFGFEPAGDVTLRGKAGKVLVHRLAGALAEPGPARGLAAFGLVSPMIGRTEELDRLHAAFERMRRGRAQVVCLVGEAGTGKSRLIAEFLTRLQAAGELERIALRRAACASLGEPPYGVFAALFREGYEVAPDDSLEVARAKLAQGLASLGARAEVADAITPILSYLLGVEEARPRELDPEQLKRQITLAARMLIERRLEQGPVLIVVEDLHWADTASVELLRDIADQLSERPLMLIATHRPETPPPLMARAAETIIRLSPLSAEETQAMLSGLFGAVDEVAFAPVRHLVARQAGGNPLFVEEIVRMLVSAGALTRRGERWTYAGDCQAANVPPTLQGLLLSRIDRLPPDSRRLLQAAAVLGISFDEPLLHAIANGGRDGGGGIDRLVEAELIQEVGRGNEGRRLRFVHALVHEVVYENLLLARRSELHDRAARAIEHAFGESPARLGDLEALGHHWSLGSDKPKGARCLVAAGDRARAVYANDDAMRHYRRALQTLDACPGAEVEIQAVRERLGDLLALTGTRSEALAQYEAAQRTLEAADERGGAARLQRKIGRLHWEAGDRERARACFAAGLALLGDDGSPIERAQLYQEVGRLAFRAGDNARAVEWAERALAEAVTDESGEFERTREIAAMQAQAHNTLGVALARMGRLEEAVARIEQSIALAEQHELLQAACRGYTNLGVLYSSFDPRRSIATCLRGLETAKKVGDLGFQSHLYANLAVAYCTLTDRCEAEGLEAAKIAIDLDRRLGLLDHLAVPLIVLGQIAQCHGNHALARASYEEALGLAEQTGEPQLLFPCYDGLATLNLDAGNVAMAEAYLTKSQEVCERAGVEPDALLVLPFLC
jgi:adenylate cyclase